MSVLSQVRAANRRLCREVGDLPFREPVACVYNPLDYAARSHAIYLRRFAATPKRVVFLGMNPGPYGMAQTGVPFGEVAAVRDWMRIEARVGRPDPEHPKRPVLGFQCTRSEVSGARLWGAVARTFETPERFFSDHFVANYCPLVFMEEGGRNRTPDKLPQDERAPLFEICDAYLLRLVRALRPEWVVGVGRFAADRAAQALEASAAQEVRIGRILHPSPANPNANRDWLGKVRRELRSQGIC